MGGSLATNDERFFVDCEGGAFVFAGDCCETRRHVLQMLSTDYTDKQIDLLKSA
jgi:hypothetical protein